ncbi:type IV toxin-antitoxin system AbiEi family antitoxin domain-containing protein [Gordonia rhizosphera]|uniref:Uncharacterized protein n=1 Tax=Gordonia rhizosphera NBRC 16068 TaxID=1108045 RepID=K6UZY7_9ACTN|nr:type IV toxin-antitoxin system AbiEi family antitoxin domain-containing protein [Gordonia rhizosphera]GAB89118.1 hypothetical protein GORHZ_050_00350 [Gordonia rhizosphera NBRC 16068]
MDSREAVRRHLAGHDGVITMSQALAQKMSRAAVHRRVKAGEWLRVANGVYRAADHAMTNRARMRIAVASGGERAVLCGPAAAWWLGLTDGFPSSITVICRTKGRHSGAIAGMQVSYRRLDDVDVVDSDGLAVTSIALTVLDTAVVTGASVVDNALLLRRVTVDQLAAAFERYPRRSGATGTRRLIEALRSGARSEAERLAVGIFGAGGITGWKANHSVCGYLADFVFDDARVIVEIDGFAFHRDSETFQRDRTKRNAWTADGWTVLNFTWNDLDRRPEHVREHVQAATADARLRDLSVGERLRNPKAS